MVLSKELTQMEKPNKRQAASLEERAYGSPVKRLCVPEAANQLMGLELLI